MYGYLRFLPDNTRISGLGPFWTLVHANWTWSKPELLEGSMKVGISRCLPKKVDHPYSSLPGRIFP